MDPSWVVEVAQSVDVRTVLGGALLAAWIVGEIVILVRAGLSEAQIWLPSALVKSIWHGQWRTSADRGSGALILLSFYVWVFVTWGSFELRLLELPWFAFYVGVCIASVGVGVRLWALRVLGRHFSVMVTTTADQRLVRTGPYRRVRHPGYTGILLISIGLPALMLSGVGLLVGGILIPVVFAYRIRVEEIALRARFGREYEEYRLSTWYVLPHLI